MAKKNDKSKEKKKASAKPVKKAAAKPAKKAAAKKTAKPAKKAAPAKKAKAPAKASAKAKPSTKKAAPKKAEKPTKVAKLTKAAAKAVAKAAAKAMKTVGVGSGSKAPAKEKPAKRRRGAEEGEDKEIALKATPGKAPPVAAEAEALAPEEETGEEEIVLTDAEGRRYCRVKDCDQLSTVDGYCRYHYLLFWKKIQVRKKILSEGKLERYIEDLTARYPDKFLDMLRKDLRSEKEFLAAIQELEIDESAVDEFEDEAQTYIDEVRGMGEATSSREDEDF